MKRERKILNEQDIAELLILYEKIGCALACKQMHIEYFRGKAIIVEKGVWRDKHNKSKHHLFEEFTPEGRLFKTLWNKTYKKGIEIRLAKKFKMSVATVYRIRVKLNLLPLGSPEHPGRKKLYKKIKKMYTWENKSSLWIGKTLRPKMCSESVRKILNEMGVKIRVSHCTNPLYFSTRSGIYPTKLIKMIREMYENNKLPAAIIAKRLKIDPSTVSTKLKAMNILLRQNHKYLEGGYPCWWCGKTMEKVWQNKGARKQRYHDKCSNMAKDFRRYINGVWKKGKRFKVMESFLKEAWGKDYQEARKKLISVKPIIRR